MMSQCQRPTRTALCVMSGLWILAGLWFGATFFMAGNFLGAAIMAIFGLAALGLWFQSRLSAVVLLLFAVAGIIFSLSKIGHAPVLRVVSPICWAVWSISLLVEYLRGETSA